MKPTKRPALLILLLLSAVTAGFFAGDVCSENDKPKGEEGKPYARATSGKARLKEGAKPIEVKLGKNLTATGKISITDWFGAKVVSGQVDVENKTDEKIYTSVSLILFDKDGTPLGCASQGMDADPKEKTIWGGFIIKLPHEQLAQVRSWTYLWYEDDRPIGTR